MPNRWWPLQAGSLVSVALPSLIINHRRRRRRITSTKVFILVHVSISELCGLFGLVVGVDASPEVAL